MSQDDDNKWVQPEQPPPPLFLGKKERDLIKQVNDEVIERVVGQQVLYYAIDLNTTNFHPIYGEAIKKSFLSPIRVYALVEMDQGLMTTYSEKIGLDKEFSIIVHFHKRRLTEDQDLFVREGDFVSYGQNFYEIVTLKEPKELFGQVDRRIEVVAECIKSREGFFNGE